MRQLWLLPDVLHFPLSCYVRLILLPTLFWDGSALWRGRTLGPYLCVRGDIPPRTSFKINWAQQDWARSLLVPFSPLGHGWASCGAPGPLLTLGVSPLQVVWGGPSILDVICLSQPLHVFVYERGPIVTNQSPGDPEPCNDIYY